MNRTWLLFAALLFAAPAPIPAQTIRVDVHLINVAFAVRDTQGNLVNGLTQDDFDISEDGVPQKISFFSRASDLPLNLGLIVDFSGSQEQSIKPHHKDLEAFLKAVLTPRDRAFLICFANRIRQVSDFSPTGKDLISALSEYESLTRKNKALPFEDVGPRELRAGATNTALFDAIWNAITFKLDPIDGGRKALVIFTDGDDNSSAHDEIDTIEAGQRSDVVFFCVRYTELNKGRLTARNKNGITTLERLSHETGGVHFDAGKEDLAKGFRQIGDQLRSSYELAYHTTNPLSDGSFHKITLRAKRPDLVVQSKTGYYSK